MAFERLGDEGGGALAVPEFGERRCDAGEAAFALVAFLLVFTLPKKIDRGYGE